MTESLAGRLLRLSEAGEPALLWGRLAKPYLGREFDRLLASGVLVEEAPATDWDVCASCECDLGARPIQEIDGRLIAACPYDHRCDTVLDAEDLRSFRIGAASLVREIALVSGFRREPTQVMPGVWHLGATPAGRTVFMVLAHAASAQPRLSLLLKAVERTSAITLLAPAQDLADRLRFLDAGIHVVPSIAALAAGDHGFTIDVALLDPPASAPRLSLDVATRGVRLDAAQHSLSPQSFALLQWLAQAARTKFPYVSQRDIEEMTWGSGIHRVSRDARDVVRELRDELAAGAGDAAAVRALIENKRGAGWRLTLPASEIDLCG